MKPKSSTKKTGILILIAEALLVAGNIIGMSYIDYAYTYLGHIDAVTMSTAMTVVSVLSLVASFFTGAIVQMTRSKMGKFREWILIGSVMLMVGGLLTVTTFSQNASVTVVVISIGYLLFNISLDFICNSKYNLFERMAQGDTKQIDTYNSRSYAGGNVGFTLYPLILMSLVAWIGGKNENLGFFGTQLVFGALTLVGMLILLKISKPFSQEGAQTEEEMPRVGIGQMIKSLVVNKPALTVFIGEMVRCIGYALFNFLLVYQCCNVFNSFSMMNIGLVIISVSGIAGSLLAPRIISRLGGRKRATITVAVLAGIVYIAIAFLGQNMTAFFILVALATIIQTVADSVEAVLYLDAGEYWYHKTGNDTRAFIMGAQNISVKIAYAIASPLLGVIMVACNFMDESAILTGADAAHMTMYTGLVAAAGYILLAVILLVFHKVSDKEMETYIAENAEKDAALYGGQA